MKSAYEAVFGGINRLDWAQTGEFSRCENVICDRFPVAECGIGEQSVLSFDRKIKRAFPNADNGKDYESFEGVYEDGSFEYYSRGSDFSLQKQTRTVTDADSLYRIGDVFYSTDKNYYTTPLGSGIISCVPGMPFSGTVKYQSLSNDNYNIVFTYGTTYLGINFEVGMVLAFRITDEYIKDNPSAKYLNSFCYTTSNVNTYTVVEVGSGYVVCHPLTYGGKAYSLGQEFTFVSSDYCYLEIKAPVLSCVCTHLNRCAGVTRDGRSIVLSKPGEYNRFYDFSGESTDSYSVDVSAGGDFYGCVSYDSALIAFKANCMYALWGDVPSNFQLTEISSDIGCIDKDSICISDGDLYFLSANGFYKYSGSKPVCISKKLDKVIKKAKSASCGQCLYVLCTFADDQKELLCYNTAYKIWYSLSYLPNDIFCQNSKLYLVYDNEIKRLDTSVGSEWFLESGNILEKIFRDRAVVEINVRVRFFDDDSFINTYTATDNGEFIQHISLSGKGVREFTIPVRFSEAKSVRLAFYGSGKCRILDMRRIYSSIE